ncbi:M23 family metallopeptidase [Treponema pectinovorum]|uniref:M23 family metallopeptidase n=1 Tax=Treponema pectinovorum TaxID=164 RepID=UPI0011CAE125|nr:M23 family metallopeptidase [Treponema pectinovorum]
MKSQLKNRFLFFFIIFFNFFLTAQASDEIHKNDIFKIETQKIAFIENPSSKNLIFRQFLEDASFNNKILPENLSQKTQNEDDFILSFYKIKVPENMDFIWFSSRVSPVYKDTISTLNRLSSADADIAGKILLVPSFSGLFIPEKPKSPWEQLLYKEFITDGSLRNTKVFVIDGEKFYFLQKKRLSPTMSLFFLDTNMVSPLKSSVLTSDFGYRISPISGKWKFHSGIDLASPEGADVFACKSGEISQTGFNLTYGNYIIITHYNSMTSVYAHLSKILVEKGQKINAGSLIGKVGSTGASTGSHLHFELRKNGSPTNPGKLINF